MPVDYKDGLLNYIKERVMRDASILYISQYSSACRNYVWFNTGSIKQTVLYEGTLKDVEDIGHLYLFLHRKYGFSNILGFLPA
jgi:hypothetical protein